MNMAKSGIKCLVTSGESQILGLTEIRMTVGQGQS